MTTKMTPEGLEDLAISLRLRDLIEVAIDAQDPHAQAEARLALEDRAVTVRVFEQNETAFIRVSLAGERLLDVALADLMRGFDPEGRAFEAVIADFDRDPGTGSP